MQFQPLFPILPEGSGQGSRHLTHPMVTINLSPEQQKHYQELQARLEELQQLTTQIPLDPQPLQSQFGEIQKIFRDQILPGVPGNLAPATLSQVQSYLTEIHRQLRLVGMDVTFLQASRQPATAQMRQTQLRDRIQTLINYYSSLLSQVQSDTSGGKENL